MENYLISELERTFKKCSDCSLHPEYVALLKNLDNMVLDQQLIDYLCDKATSKKHIWEIHFDHLRILLRNPSSKSFDLKDFYLKNLKRSRQIAMKLFWIRGYAIYATESELIPVMEKFQKSLEGPCGYIDFNYILSVAGLPYLVKTYGYPCFIETMEKAKHEHNKISPFLRGYFTLNENMETVELITIEESSKRMQAFLDEYRSNHGNPAL